MPQVGTTLEATTPESSEGTAAPATDTPTTPTVASKASKKAGKPKGSKKATKAVKKAPKAVKGASKKSAPKPQPNGEVAKPIEALMKGGTRMRIFLALRKYPNGLTAMQIKQKTGMNMNSGDCGYVLHQEVGRKRIKVDDARTYTKADGSEGKEPMLYTLSATGKKAIETSLKDPEAEGGVDARKTGARFGAAWTSARAKAEKARKEKKPAKNKAKTK